jgi:membrane protein
MQLITRKRIRQYILLRNSIVRLLRLIVIPGFQGVPLYDVLVFFITGLFKGSVSIRASAVAFNFFLP